MKQIVVMSFSPTKNTQKLVCTIGSMLKERLGLPVSFVDLTKKEEREKKRVFDADDLVVIGLPTYAGRLPNKIVPSLQEYLYGQETKCICAVTFGNRSPDGSRIELEAIMHENGFVPIASCAVVGVHAFSDVLTKNRDFCKDEEDLQQWCQSISLDTHGKYQPQTIPSYYVPKEENGQPAHFLKAKPVTDRTRCDSCGLCAILCPMQSISPQKVWEVPGICIKCQACVKRCPTHAKSFEDASFLSHVKMLEKNFCEPKENEYIIY